MSGVNVPFSITCAKCAINIVYTAPIYVHGESLCSTCFREWDTLAYQYVAFERWLKFPTVGTLFKIIRTMPDDMTWGEAKELARANERALNAQKEL